MRNRAEREAAALARLKDPARSQGNRIPGGPLVPSGITRMSGLSARNEFGERVQPIVAAEVVAASGEDGQEATCGGEEDGQEASCGGEEDGQEASCGGEEDGQEATCGGEEDGQEASCGGEEDGQEATCGSEEAEQMMVGEDGEQCQRHRREKTKWTAFSAVQESMATGPDALQAGEISLNAPGESSCDNGGIALAPWIASCSIFCQAGGNERWTNCGTQSCHRAGTSSSKWWLQSHRLTLKLQSLGN